MSFKLNQSSSSPRSPTRLHRMPLTLYFFSSSTRPYLAGERAATSSRWIRSSGSIRAARWLCVRIESTYRIRAAFEALFSSCVCVSAQNKQCQGRRKDCLKRLHKSLTVRKHVFAWFSKTKRLVMVSPSTWLANNSVLYPTASSWVE